ncbi:MULTISPECIES: bifunctional diaminohydroxyphosphoribosylaminopyrimidine deaminase/5-amino-6-(5-phosphoribosylamino)uracil reductase RibD [Deefgea]|uniref:Riboflavin biosynthesis protein RibD n=1 Tax=Deefgea chitinilytica TaxID=570276 RepID=A0ABS2C951_9NEIS|nr:bifunctional diaminohydroxyphosphoribosylaminopyrimidine deaminase/5-amino-6-(5-phosphoribosylamino)uracil reductase RibD [Deefgea chitinilytica]
MVQTVDFAMMATALRYAAEGECNSSPNPCVGCVIVKEGQVVGYGHSQVAGGAHAEVMALAMAGDAAQGATAYVTLEPCSHFGKTPPCADALIQAQVSRVVVALRDPNPLVSGQGIDRLRQHGITVDVGVLSDVALEHHKGFFTRMILKRPWVRIKTAASLDGRIALKDGQSKWITGSASRSDVQRLRARSCAMITSIETVLADDPQLNVREFTVLRQPWRVILDSQLRTPCDAKILQQSKVMIITAKDSERRILLEANGAEVHVLSDESGERVDLPAVVSLLAQRGFNEVTIEAGGTLSGAFLQAGLVDELVLYQAPILLGEGRPLASFNLVNLADQYQPQVYERRMVGVDQRITLRFTNVQSVLQGVS